MESDRVATLNGFVDAFNQDYDSNRCPGVQVADATRFGAGRVSDGGISINAAGQRVQTLIDSSLQRPWIDALLQQAQAGIEDLAAGSGSAALSSGGGLRVSSSFGLQLQSTAQGLIPSDNVIDNFARGWSSNGSDWSVLEGEKPISYELGGMTRKGLGLVYDGLTGAGDFQDAGQALRRGDYLEGAMYGVRGGATAALTAVTLGDYALAKAAVAGSTGLRFGSTSAAEGAGLRMGTRDTTDYGVAFFGDSNLSYYTREGATIGRDGKSFFFMPLEDSGVVRNAGDAARYTGRAPSAEQA